MPGDGGHLAQAGGKARAVLLRLPELVLVELPDAAVLFEDRAGILAGRLRFRPWLAGIGRRADVHVERSFAVERDAFVAMLAPAWQVRDHDLGSARGLQLPGRHFIALHGWILAMYRYPFRSAMPVLLPSPNFSFMSKRPSPLVSRSATTPPFQPLRPTLQRDVDVAVGGHRHVARRAQAIGGDQRAKSRGQRDAAVIGIAGGRGRRGRQRPGSRSQPEESERKCIQVAPKTYSPFKRGVPAGISWAVLY